MRTGPEYEVLLPRVVPLKGCSNLRDLGGYRTAEGSKVRFGRVFRSASLAGLTEADLTVFAATGLRTICDLRGEHESARAPSRLPVGERRARGGAPAHRAESRRLPARPARPGRGDRRGRARPAAHRLRGLRDRPSAALPRPVRPAPAGRAAAAPVPLLRRQGPHRLRRGPAADRARRAARNGDRGLPRHEPHLEARARAAAGHAGRRPRGPARRAPAACSRARSTARSPAMAASKRCWRTASASIRPASPGCARRCWNSAPG